MLCCYVRLQVYRVTGIMFVLFNLMYTVLTRFWAINRIVARGV